MLANSECKLMRVMGGKMCMQGQRKTQYWNQLGRIPIGQTWDNVNSKKRLQS